VAPGSGRHVAGEGDRLGSDEIELTYSFNVHGVLFVGDEEKIAPVEREIRELSSSLQLVKDEQAYLVVRERVHRDSELRFLPNEGTATVLEVWNKSPRCRMGIDPERGNQYLCRSLRCI
jgi:hypothetical protein